MRADLTDPKYPEWAKYLFTCEADDHHFLMVDWWEDEDHPGTLDTVPAVYAPTMRQRIVTAVKVLLGRKAWVGHGVLLDEGTAVKLRATIDEYLAHEATKRKRREEADAARSDRGVMARVAADRLSRPRPGADPMSDDMIRCPKCGITVPCKVEGDQVSISEHYRALPPPAVDVDPEFWGLVMDVPETTPAPNAEQCDASWGVVSAARALQEGWMG